MANRILRDWTDSENIDKLSFQAEVTFTRLFMKADDYGCFHANPKLVKAALFPLKDLRETDISRWLDECQKAGLIAFYNEGGKKYLVIKNFGQRLRAMKSKFPLPIDSDTLTDDSNPPLETKRNETETEYETEKEIPLERKVFRIGVKVYVLPVSEWFKENKGIFLEDWLMKNGREKLEPVFEKLDLEYNGYQFTNENHVQNTFRSLWAKVKAKPGPSVGTDLEEQLKRKHNVAS